MKVNRQVRQVAQFLVWFALVCGFTPWTTWAANKTNVRLLLPAERARPGETVLVGVQLRMPPGWHTYWRNAGDSGSPTQIKWKLPAGLDSCPRTMGGRGSAWALVRKCPLNGGRKTDFAMWSEN